MQTKPTHIFSLISRIRGKANQFLLQELKSYGLEGLAPVHGDILYTLFVNGPMTMKELAWQIDRKKSTLTTLVEKLIKLGFVEKRVVVTDQRACEIWLTDPGYGLRQPLLEISSHLIEKAYQGISKKEQGVLMGLLQKLDGNM